MLLHCICLPKKKDFLNFFFSKDMCRELKKNPGVVQPQHSSYDQKWVKENSLVLLPFKDQIYFCPCINISQ